MKRIALPVVLLASFASAQVGDPVPAGAVSVLSGPALPQLVLSTEQQAEAAYQQSLAYQAQAEAAYPVPYYDRVLWKMAVDQAFLATQLSPTAERRLHLARLYTRTQWWINAYRTWQQVTPVGADRELAAQSATQLRQMAISRGDQQAARTYAAQAEAWR